MSCELHGDELGAVNRILRKEDMNYNTTGCGREGDKDAQQFSCYKKKVRRRENWILMTEI